MTTDTLPVVASDQNDGGPASPRRWFVLALALAVLTYSMMQTMLLPVLPALQSALHTDGIGVSWILTAYLLSGAVAAPVLGSFGDRFGHRRMLLIAMGVFVAGSVVAAVAPNLSVILIGRVLQGASTASFPLALAIVGTHLAGDARRSATGWLSGTVGLGAGLALVIGGIIASLAPWQVLFWVGAVFGAASMLLVAISVPSHAVHGQACVDFAGIGLLAALLVGVLLVVSQASSWGITSPGIITSAVVAVLAGIALFVVERRVPAPLLDLPVLWRPTIAIGNLLAVLLGFVPYLFYVGMPLLLQTPQPAGAGMGPQATGWVMFPGTIVAFIGGRFASVLMRRMRSAWVSALAMALIAVGAVGIALWPHDLTANILFYAVMGLGAGIGTTVVADLIAQGSEPHELGGLLGVNGVLRTVGSSFGAPIAMLIIAGGSGVGGFVALFLVAALASILGVVLSMCLRSGSRTRGE
ncbi:MFS transporter [Microbacterium bovistercoris]|uniref:MFS transporter n=1 Tax=Microbacterium bovistercoris TaxID=2293570 RepID=A0A371NT11_9MICO|nr:MFS transporter [Microbacterium bovistercoris]REJ05434.1 MFS transporter [Microbacterium bovistercoris]